MWMGERWEGSHKEAMAYRWRSEDNSVESVLSFYYVDWRDQTPGTCFVDQAGLEYGDLPAFASQVWGG